MADSPRPAGIGTFWALGILGLGLVAAIIYGFLYRVESLAWLRGSVNSEKPTGASALGSWLISMGYAVDAWEADDALSFPQDQVLLVLSPGTGPAVGETSQIHLWVMDGGTLIIAQDHRSHPRILSGYDVEAAPLHFPIQRTPFRLPTLAWSTTGDPELRAQAYLRTDRSDAAVHLGDCRTPLLLSFREGKGQVFVLSSDFPFTNAGLRGANAQMVLNLVRMGAQPGERVLFDERHRQPPPEILAPEWLRMTAEGRALLYAVAAVTLYLFLTGRTFAPPAAAVPEGRPALEFVAALSDLRRRLGDRAGVRRQYREQLKRRLARQYRFDPALPDAEFWEELRRCRGPAEVAALQALWSRPCPDEAALVKWVNEVLQWR